MLNQQLVMWWVLLHYNDCRHCVEYLFFPQGDACMHLTNYAINKHSKDFVRDDEIGSKRRIVTVNRWFEENNYPVDKIWADIEVSR